MNLLEPSLSRYGNRHIAITSISLLVGGIEKQYVRLANEMVARGHTVDFLLCQKSGEFLDNLDPRVKVIELTGIAIPRKNLLSIVRYLKKEQPEAILGGHDAMNVLVVLAKSLAFSKTRTVTVAHNTLAIRWAENMTVRKAIIRKILKIIWTKADRISAVSQGASSSLARLLGISTNRISVPYVPIFDQSIIELAEKDIEEPWFTDGNGKILLIVGRLVKAKNIALTFQALHILNQAPLDQPLRLIVLGEGEEREHLEGLRDQLGLTDWIKMPGSVSNPYPYMKKADVLVLSSDREGLPAVLVEGLAVGIPIVTTDCPSGADEIVEDGKWGRLVPVGDAEKLAQGIADSLNFPHKINPESYQRFTVNASTNAYEDLMFGSVNMH